MRVIAVLIAGAILAGAAVVVCVAPPRENDTPAFETAAIVPSIAPLEDALTLGVAPGPDRADIVLVILAFDGASARARPVPVALSGGEADPMAVMARAGRAALEQFARGGDAPLVELPLAAFRPSGRGILQVATGTNFPEHAAEVGATRPFFFPKFGPATSAVTTVTRPAGALLDYEVEICARFDRAIASLADLEAAIVGLFLCGDFTDRAVLTRLVEPGDLDSGRGFSDAKSGPDFFPTGPFLVFPRDPRAFVAAERITTSVDGVARQDARGAAMTLDFAGIATRVTEIGAVARWTHRGAPVPLVPDGVHPVGAALMSGTPAGVIYRAPDTREIACGVAAYVCLGGFLGGSGPVAYVRERYIERLASAGRFLRPNQVVRHGSLRLGAIEVRVR
jgi:2-keto-4-pentenoate hydratase/2-oxohepta-3-ene-1,7-dioic acid hydratase in catechol pathway